MPEHIPSYLTFTMPTISFDRKRRINAFKIKVINRNNTYRKRRKINKNKLHWECLLCWNANNVAALPSVRTYSSFAIETFSKMRNVCISSKISFLGVSWHTQAVVKEPWKAEVREPSCELYLLIRRGRPWQIQGISLGFKSGILGGRKRMLDSASHRPSLQPV